MSWYIIFAFLFQRTVLCVEEQEMSLKSKVQLNDSTTGGYHKIDVLNINAVWDDVDPEVSRIVPYGVLKSMAISQNITIPDIQFAFSGEYVLLNIEAQCFQYVHKIIPSPTATDCSLPSYCSSVIMTNGAWFTGLCQGVAGKLYFAHDVYHFDDNWWMVYYVLQPDIIHDELPIYMPLYNNTFMLLRNYDSGQYVIMSSTVLGFYPRFNVSSSVMFYGYASDVDYRFCVPHPVAGPKHAIMSRAYHSFDEVMMEFTFPYTFRVGLHGHQLHDNLTYRVTPGRMLITPDIVLSYFENNHEIYAVTERIPTYNTFRCDPYKSTNSFVDSTVTYLTRILTDLAWVIFTLFKNMVVFLFHFVVNSFAYFNHRFLFTEYFLLFLLLLYYTHHVLLSLLILVFPLSIFGFFRPDIIYLP